MQILVPVFLPTGFLRLSWAEQNFNFSKGYKRRLEIKKLLLLSVEVHCYVEPRLVTSQQLLEVPLFSPSASQVMFHVQCKG